MTKQDQANAEKAAQWLLASWGYTQQRKAVRTKYQKVDFFGADIMAMDDYRGYKIFCQVTTGGYEAIRQRKRKLEQYIFSEHDDVFIFVMKKEKKGRSFEYWFEINYFDMSGDDWYERPPEPIKREWFTRYGIANKLLDYKTKIGDKKWKIKN